MVAQLLRLKLTLMANTFRRSPWQIFGLVVAIIYGLFLTFAIVTTLIGARFATDVHLIRNIVVVVGSLTVLGFALIPLLVGADDTLDPRRFSLFGINTNRLALGLSVTALIGVPSVVLALCSLATIVTWSRSFGSMIFAVIAAALVVATCTVLSRVSTSIAAFFLATRRARELGGVLALLAIVMASPVVILLLNVDWGRDGLAVLQTAADWASWTPFGAVWAVPAEAALGNWGQALLKLLIAIAVVGLLWLAWRGLVAVMMVTPAREAKSKSYGGLGWFGTMPHTPGGAIAARSITYWGRDPRYWISLVMIPVVPVFPVIALLIAGVSASTVALIPLPIMCLFLGWTIHNDVAYDSTAVWLHVVSGTRGVADRIGRLTPVLMLAVPFVAVGTVVTLFYYGSWDAFPAVIGVNTAIVLIGIGLSSLSSGAFPYPATKPGDSPFSQPQHSGGAAAIIQSLSFFATIMFATPAIVCAVLGFVLSPDWFFISMVVGFASGLLVLVGGIWGGGAIVNRRGPEIMAFVTKDN